MRRLTVLLLTSALFALTGCDMLGIESASVVAARRDAEGRAVGGACRQSGRGIEDCYSANKKSDKAAVFAGWRDMNDYMRENKMETMAPQAAAAAPAPADEEAPGKKSAKAAAEGAHGKDS